MTMPTLIANYQKQVLMNQLKKSYSVINNAVAAMRAEYEGLDPVDMPFVHAQWNHQKYLDVSLFEPEFAKHLITLWHRSDPNSSFCFNDIADYNYRYSNKNLTNPNYVMTRTGNNYTWQLKDGACIEFAYGSNWEWDGKDKRRFIIDVNGSYKAPNTIGKDIFYFEFLPNGKILPYGWDKTDSEVKSNCFSTGTTCAVLIMKAGFNVPKDYPWK